MGSRSVAVVCRNAEVAVRRFGVDTGETGIIVTRTGRRFFEDMTTEKALLDRIVAAMDKSGLWDRLETDWIILDAELMPWSAKAQQLLRRQYAPVGAAAKASLDVALRTMETALREGSAPEGLAELGARLTEKSVAASQYVDAYRRYCWTVNGLEDLKLAPFHILATEGGVHVDKNHTWHMDTLAELCDADPHVLFKTPYLTVDVTDDQSVARGVHWWTELTARGGEGMVVKPYDFLGINDSQELIQPAIKCRGKEYLRIIYGPDYDRPEHLERLRKRGLAKKRSLAMREFALGIEALERFVRREPLRRVHECVFAVLAMESEPVDPRL